MAKKTELDAVKEEIRRRKEQRDGISQTLGESRAVSVNSKDAFLGELFQSVETGRPSKSSETIKKIANIAEGKKDVGDTMTPNTSNSMVSEELNRFQNNTPISQPPVNYGERDDKLFAEIERKKREMEANVKAMGNNQVPQPLYETPRQTGVINENQLNEAVNNIINDKFSVIVEQAMKNSIIELYTSTKIAESIEENRALIKGIVIETIRELQSKKKS